MLFVFFVRINRRHYYYFFLLDRFYRITNFVYAIFFSVVSDYYLSLFMRVKNEGLHDDSIRMVEKIGRVIVHLTTINCDVNDC